MKTLKFFATILVLGLICFSCGKSGKSIKIGNQIWTTENLNVDHYRNGAPIPEVQDPD